MIWTSERVLAVSRIKLAWRENVVLELKAKGKIIIDCTNIQHIQAVIIYPVLNSRALLGI